jgi:hypothetical protein
VAHKSIIWQSWNAIADEYISSFENEIMALEEELMSSEEMSPNLGSIIGASERMGVIHTPLGMYPIDSIFKPSDRWDCRIGTTNFSITQSVKDILAKDVEGIEALRILGRYTFFIGVPISFDFKDVRVDIEKRLCIYTEREVLTEETQATVELVKAQLKNKKHWSILVASTGNVDYVTSDSLDHEYLQGLNHLEELKQSVGGIILRGENG